MLEFYNRLSISKKLNFMSISTALIAGVLSVVFIDSKNIKESLLSLSYEKRVKQAFAMDDKWKLLGAYSRDNSPTNTILSSLNSETPQFWDGWDLYTISSINIENKDIGSLVVITSMNEFVMHIAREAFFISLFIIFGVVLAYKYHTILSKEILTPISKLNESTNIIIETKALTARVGVYNNDEIGELAKNFNVMLDKLYQSHDELNKQKDLMAYKAHHDELTGLPNRALFNDRLEFALIKASRKESVVAVFFLDLDRFKEINDTYGHDAGDEVLKVFAQRLKESIRAEDTLARMGGDEFMIIIEDHINPDTSAVVAQKIVDAMKEPIELEADTIKLSTSNKYIGFYICKKQILMEKFGRLVKISIQT